MLCIRDRIQRRPFEMRVARSYFSALSRKQRAVYLNMQTVMLNLGNWVECQQEIGKVEVGKEGENDAQVLQPKCINGRNV